MFKPGTVFIIGAGANAEIGMPQGGALGSIISKSFYFESHHVYGYRPKNSANLDLFDHIRRLAAATNTEIDEQISAALLFHQGVALAGSIDEYLSRHADKPLHASLGKLAIIHSLIAAERQSKLFCDPFAIASDIVKSAENTWLSHFANQLFIGRPANDINRLFDDIAIISFNYDRCLQRYLIAAIQEAYHVTLHQALEVIARLNIVYPYGTLGSLLPASRDCLAFGADVSSYDLTPRLDTIRTFAEHHENPEQRTKIHQLVAEANALVFLGFGFHAANLALLRPPQSEPKPVTIVATGFGLSIPNIESVKKRLRGLRPVHGSSEPIVERNLNAADLMADYRMVLGR